MGEMKLRASSVPRGSDAPVAEGDGCGGGRSVAAAGVRASDGGRRGRGIAWVLDSGPYE